MAVEFTDYSIHCKGEINQAGLNWCKEVANEIKSRAQANSRVKTGQTKGSFDTHLNASAGEALVGSPLENAIWEEYGTGEYALKGDGRKTAWIYKDPVSGKFYRTTGKRPSRALHKAYKAVKPAAEKQAQVVFGRMK